MAGTLGVSLHDRLRDLRWLSPGKDGKEYDVTAEGAKALAHFGIDLDAARNLRRRFACACLDWSERRPHLAGALAAALLEVALKKKWLVQDLDSCALRLTTVGRREMQARFGLQL